ncbi:MAG TPA: hypothetical protein VNX46_18060, partial [Candidatus Acidoferrum sp.]|nr:hypothetical protein [Candidatus Acidoferrum sp.]
SWFYFCFRSFSLFISSSRLDYRQRLVVRWAQTLQASFSLLYGSNKVPSIVCIFERAFNPLTGVRWQRLFCTVVMFAVLNRGP